jgi:hypothetical protein
MYAYFSLAVMVVELLENLQSFNEFKTPNSSETPAAAW